VDNTAQQIGMMDKVKNIIFKQVKNAYENGITMHIELDYLY
jgi:hypothetical protein